MIERMVDKRILRECAVFQALTDADLEKVSRLAVAREYDAGAVVFRQGDAADDLIVLQEGKIALQMQLSVARPQLNRSVTVDIVTSNEVFGWSAIVEPHVYTLTAVCLQKVKVLAINGVRLQSLLQENHEISHQISTKLIRVVAARLDETRRLLISERMSTARTE